ncbi:MAG: polysaccharide deacetylase family protein [Methylococcales bacterium]|nr:polysaccharide deacetylase family protein [Methylococcales bacterium]
MVYSQKGIVVRLIYLFFSLTLWLLTLGGRLFKTHRLILCYHDMTDDNAVIFRRQMDLIANRVVSLDNTQLNTSKPAVVLTFDDAFENIIENVIPTIEALNLPISIYVVTDDLGQKPNWLRGSRHSDEKKLLMTEAQIKTLSKHPLISFGIHTHTHPRLTELDRNEVIQELAKSKKILENMSAQRITALAYPHGDFNAETTNIAHSQGLFQLLTLEEKMLPRNQSQGQMGRFLMEADVWALEFRLTVDGAYTWLYYFRQMIRTLKISMGK